MTYAVKHFFEQNPKLAKAFETVDGVMHQTEAAAKKWNKTHADKTIVSYENPLLKKEEVKEAK